ncbi:peptidyl-prolyl cis-trans isomerase [Bacillaceae bacterium Marseille-Q3522]|nr:peptidyl-prolyl cis-trans isomerase [Bacillaceae bacterium Marseille-Q3522]
MNSIITLKGKVKYTITLDPSVWIFDDRKLDLTSYFLQNNEQKNENINDTEKVALNWEREIREGSVFPPTLKTEKRYQKEKILTGTFAIPLLPFINNAEPENDATEMIIEQSDGQVIVPLEDAKTFVAGFSKDGKPLLEDGPIHLYFGDGRNKHNPYRDIQALIVK